MQADLNICKKCDRFIVRACPPDLVPYYGCETPNCYKIKALYVGKVLSWDLTTELPPECKYKLEHVVINQSMLKQLYLWIVWRIRRVC